MNYVIHRIIIRGTYIATVSIKAHISDKTKEKQQYMTTRAISYNLCTRSTTLKFTNIIAKPPRQLSVQWKLDTRMWVGKL